MLKFGEICVFLKKPSRDPIWHQFLHFWAPLLASRDPVGIQSGSSRDPVGHQIFEFLAPRLDLSGSSQNHPKTRKNTAKMLFFMNLAPDIGARLDPDWIPTGQKRCPKMQKLVPDWVPTGSQRDPDWIHRSETENRKFQSSHFKAPCGLF